MTLVEGYSDLTILCQKGMLLVNSFLLICCATVFVSVIRTATAVPTAGDSGTSTAVFATITITSTLAIVSNYSYC